MNMMQFSEVNKFRPVSIDEVIECTMLKNDMLVLGEV
jgi:hypothetical protein